MTKHQIELITKQQLDPWLQGRSFDHYKTQFDEQGYVVFEKIMSSSEVDKVRNALHPHLTKTGRNNFEGFSSNRVYSLLTKAPDVFSDMVTHPLALAFVEADLGSSCLLSSLLAINLLPGESVQPWHYDDAQISIPLPRPSYGVSTFWAIDDTTEINGATEVVPGSHRWNGDELKSAMLSDVFALPEGETIANQDPQPRTDAIKVALPAGSLMITKGTLLHRGGANLSSNSRLIVTPQYCPGWARPLENMLLAVPKDIARTLPKRTRQLIGYNIHASFMGYVDGVHPDEVLGIKQYT